VKEVIKDQKEKKVEEEIKVIKVWQVRWDYQVLMELR
jgi:hypothetical protein